MITLTNSQARRLTLNCQGLLTKFAKREKGTREAIEQVSYIQIDTISVAVRAHHHTFWSRVPTYQPEYLHYLQAEKKYIFEYWSHAAAYLPMQDFRFSLPRKHAIASGEKHWHKRDKKLMKWVLDRIKAEGPLQSRDFGEHQRSGEWWGWKPTKVALEQLFMEGTLMVAERRGFQKVYDLAERVLPPHIDTSMPTPKEMARHLILRAIHAHGFKMDSEITYLRKGIKALVKNTLSEMVEANELVPLNIKGSDQLYYTTPDLLESIPGAIRKKQIHILSPFDNLVIQRKRLGDIFQYDYQIECYVPEPKRKYGYYSLPLLWGDSFIGRLDPKADRKSGVFYVKGLWLEPGVEDYEAIAPVFAQKLIEFAQFSGCESIVIENSQPSDFGKVLTGFLK